MKNKQNLSAEALKTYGKQIGHFLTSHMRMVFFVLALCVLIGTTLSLNLTLNKPSDESYRQEKLDSSQSTKFDEDTIEKIQNLNSQQQTSNESLPTNQRISPFSE